MNCLEILESMIAELKATSSSNEKIEIIKKHLSKTHDNLVKWQLMHCLTFVYDTRITFGITSGQALKKGKISFGPHVSSFVITLNQLERREITGQHALDMWFMLLQHYPKYKEILNAILDKDLKCRTGLQIVNKALKEIEWAEIFDYQVSLGTKYEGQAVWDDDADWYASRKYDGVRCSIFLEKGKDPLALSRQGNQIFTIGKILDELKGWTGNPIILDGEIGLKTEDGKDDFLGVMKQIRRKNHTIENPFFYCFDVIDPNKNLVFSDRQNRIYKILAGKREFNHIGVVIQYKIKNKQDFDELFSHALDYGWEGLILRKDTTYKGKRSKDIFKVKAMHDAEYKVVGVDFDKMQIVKDGREKEIDVLSAALIEHKGNQVKVGSGWTIDQRQFYFKHPEKLLDKIITVQYFEETTNKDGKKSLRFPTVKCVHGDKREL